MKFIKNALAIILSFTIITSLLSINGKPKTNRTKPVIETQTEIDSLKPRYDDFINDSLKNPFDLKDPSSVVKTVEYDPESGNYIVTEKIGNEYFRSPTYLTFQEYLKWREQQQRMEYFNQLSGSGKSGLSASGIVDPAALVDVKKDLVERIFGGNEITIKPQGSIHLTLGLARQIMDNPGFELRAQRVWNPIFDEGIQVNVEGGIGDKMKLNFNYNTKASFDFDNKIKLKYDSEQFNEDAILKKIEAGNVSLPLRGNLIQGAQNLFGIKTELQFGHLRLTAIASQQRSEQKNVQIDKGAIKQEFEITPDQYDENRHFFLSHFNRETYEEALAELPTIKTPFRITRLEVWVIPERNETHDLRDIAALADMGEGDLKFYTDTLPFLPPDVTPIYKDYTGKNVLPDNRVSNYYQDAIRTDSLTRLKVNTSSNLRSIYNLESGKDYEMFKGRKLNESEYTYNAELGFVSLNRPLQPEDVLGVSYEYTYNYNDPGIIRDGNLYRVGEFSELADTFGKVMYVKMLKSKTQQPKNPEWDLMMKNVYYIGTQDIDRESFKLDIFYRDVDGSNKRFIPEEGFRKRPLLQVFKLDTININGDVQPDGIFDFINGVTILPRIGSIMFPVLEPFDNSLDTLLGNKVLADKYRYDDLYDKSIVEARKKLEKNRFILKGEYKAKESSEISLGTWNLQGNPVVTSGGITLTEGVDYDIDRGAGKIRIINPAVLQSGRPINVKFEDNSLFNLTQKNMLGLRADYEIRKNFNLGATYLHLFERPYTEKVSYGDDPINNRIFGLDMDFSTNADWLTRAVDKLPFLSTKAPSSISLKTELAALKPGHSSEIDQGEDQGGNIILDDFEGSSIKLYLNNENDWMISSTPSTLPESNENTLAYGANRALLSWYVAESGLRNSGDQSDPYTRLVYQQDLFDRDIPVGSLPDMRTFDINFYPSERGPYNFDIPDGYGQFSKGIYLDGSDNTRVLLKEPTTRWGGMTRYMRYSDFEAMNVEYVEFWMLNPFMETLSRKDHATDVNGVMTINLGNVSEDVLKDGLQFYENSLPLDGETVPVRRTIWGEIPLDTPLDDAFPNDKIKIKQLDLGLDGLDDDRERNFHVDYLNEVFNVYPTAQINDVANDNWQYFNEESISSQPLNDRYKKYNNPQGNFPDIENQERRGKLRPDKEELNDNKSLDITEAYYEFKIPIAAATTGDGMVLDTNNFLLREYITDVKTVFPESGTKELWYRFRIPITSGIPVGGIDGLRSIQFMRMYFSKFEKPKTFRLAEFGIVRNQWRKDAKCLSDDDLDFDVDVVGLEENEKKVPFGYESPPNVKRERLLANYDNIRQDEKSLALKFENLKDSCELTVYKLTSFDARLFKKLQLFVHAESDMKIPDGDLRLFMRFGRDFVDNYYEYIIPLKLSELANGQTVENIWLDENFIDIILKDFTDLKLERNANDIPLSQIYEKKDENNTRNPGALLRIKGNPSLGYIKGMQVGVTTYQSEPLDGEIWINELRVNGLEEKGGVAATANIDVKLADLGSINGAFNYMSIGFGALDQKLAQRSMDEVIDYDLSTSLQIGKFFPSKWKVTLPLYLQYGQTIRIPKYDTYDLDLTVKENINNAKTEEEKQELKDRSLDVITIKSMNLAGVSVNVGNTKYPWSPSNVKVGYYYTDMEAKNTIIRKENETDQKLTLDYGFNLGSKFIRPFAKVGWIKAKVIKDIHFGLLPNSFSFNTQLRKYDNIRTYREPTDIDYTFEERRFNWDRNYNLQWNFTKDLKFNFNATNVAVVDQLQKWGINDEYRDVFGEVADKSSQRQYMMDNLRKFGRPKSYNHSMDLSYNLPLRNIKILSWIDVNAKYNSGFTWTGNAIFKEEDFGNLIMSQQARSINTRFDFEKLYKSVKYLKAIDDGFVKKTDKKERRDKKTSKSKEKKERQVTAFEKIIFRPFLTLRDIKLTYKEDLQTTVPGYTNRTEWLGTVDNFSAPGIDFIVGLQPENNEDFGTWLDEAADKGWIVSNRFFSNQFYNNKRQNFGAKIVLEPINNFKIDVDFKKAYINDNSREFKNISEGTPSFQSFAVMDRGSFEVTYMGINTIFTKNYEDLFDQFSKYRETISARQYMVTHNKTSVDSLHELNIAYARGFGPQSQAVIIPAFMAAYTGEKVDNVSLDIFEDIGKIDFIPRPNWSAEYNLSRYGFMKEIFSSFKITNGYKSVLKVSQFQTDLNFLSKRFDTDDNNEKNYYVEYIIPSVILEERFDPVIGIDIKTKSDLSIRIDYKKSRNMMLSQKSLQENRAEEMVFNFGYVVKNVNMPFMKSKKSKKDKKEEAPDEQRNIDDKKPKGAKNNLRDLRISVDFSIRDMETKEYLFDSGRNGKATHGNYRIALAPSLEYNITDNFSMQMDFTYDKTVPYVNNSFPTTNYRGTVTAKYSLK